MPQDPIITKETRPEDRALSFSSAHMMWKCPASFARKHVLREKPPLDKDTTATVPGIVLDRVARAFFATVREGLPDWSLLEKTEFAFEELSKALAAPTVRLGDGKFAKDREEARKYITELLQNLRGMVESDGLVRDQGLILSEEAGFTGPTSFGTWQNPLVLNPQLRVTGQFDLFCSRNEHSPGRLVDFKASRSINYLDPHQLRLYQLALKRKWGLDVGMAGYALFPQRKFHWYRFTEQHLRETEEKLTQTAVNIGKGFFPYTPSESSCKLCPYRTVCKDAVLEKVERLVVPTEPVPTPAALDAEPEL